MQKSASFFIIAGGIGLMLLIGSATPMEAAEKVICPVCQKAGNQAGNYPEKTTYTLLRGASNAFLGWTELIRQPAAEAKEGGNVFVGIGKGFGQTVKRTLDGVAEILTFWTPKVNDDYLHFSDDCPICIGGK